MLTRPWLSNAVVSVVAAVALSLLASSTTQAAAAANTKSAAKTHPKKQVHAQVAVPQRQSAGYVPPGCNTWPYVNQAPPCWSTWPAGDPNYHGPRPGPGP
jgi:hypothetical protein